MTYPRAHLVDEKNGGYYHCTSRCVRRAWLCGKDPVSGDSYNHRKEWLERRILDLAKYFAIDLYAYAVMSNHYHVVVQTKPRDTLNWSAEEVAERWISRNGVVQRDELARKVAALIAHPKRILEIRARLSSLSWFMRSVNEPMARMANAEDDCTGRFWEGRFKSVALLDRTAVINCMVYVDLNPARANTRLPALSGHTSAVLRTKTPRNPLTACADLELTPSSYLQLLLWTHSAQIKQNRSAKAPSEMLTELGQSEAEWLRNVRAQSAWYRAYGLPEAIESYVRTLKQRWIQMPVIRSSELSPG